MSVVLEQETSRASLESDSDKVGSSFGANLQLCGVRIETT